MPVKIAKILQVKLPETASDLQLAKKGRRGHTDWNREPPCF